MSKIPKCCSDRDTVKYYTNVAKGIDVAVHVSKFHAPVLVAGEHLLLDTCIVSDKELATEAPFNPLSLLTDSIQYYVTHRKTQQRAYSLRKLSDFGEHYARGYIYKKSVYPHTKNTFPLPMFLQVVLHSPEIVDYLVCNPVLSNLLYDSKLELKTWLSAWAVWADTLIKQGYLIVGAIPKGNTVAYSDVLMDMLTHSVVLEDEYKEPQEVSQSATEAVIVLPPRAANDSFTQAEKFAIETNAVVDFSIPFNASAEQLQGLWNLIQSEVHSRYPELDTVTLKDNKLVVTYEGALGEHLDNFYVQLEEVQRAVLKILHACQGAFD